MRILLMGPYPPPHGGVQTNLVAIQKHLARHQTYCAVINLTRHRRVPADNIYYPRNVFELLWLLIKLKYDVIHLHFGGDLTPRLLGLALVCSLVPRTRTVLTFHSGGYPESEAGRRAGRRSLAGFVLRRIDRVIGVNKALVSLFARLGIPSDKILLIEPHAVAAIDAADSLPDELETFICSHKPTLITVGLLETEYDLALQIDALELVRRRFDNAGLLIIGSGSIEKDLRRHIRDKPYAEHVLLIGDVPHAATLAAIKASDLMLRTTLYDGDSISVREALYLGVPVIATDNAMRPPGPILIPVSDKAALVRAIESVIGAPAMRKPRLPPGEEATGRNLDAILQVYRELGAENSG